MRGFGLKIPLHHQLAGLGMQLVDVSAPYLLRRGTFARKGRRHFLADRLKRNLGFEF